MRRTENLRPRPSNQKFEKLLQGVKLGSTTHMSELRAAWPKDSGDIKRAVEALFTHLSAATIPRNRGMAIEKRNVRQTVIVKEVLEVLDGAAVDSIKCMDKDGAAQVLDIFREHITGYIAALEYRARHFAMAQEGGNAEKLARLGNILHANAVIKLLGGGGFRHFETEEGHHALTSMVDCLYTCWMRGTTVAGSLEDTSMSPSDYTNTCRVLDKTMSHVNEDSLKAVWIKKVASLDRRSLRQFAKSFPYYCLEWSTVHAATYGSNPQDLDCTHFTTMISFAHILSEGIPAFERALLKANFPSLAVKLACKLRRAPATMGRPGLISTDIACRLVEASVSRAWTVAHVLPQLVESGLLELLAEDSLARDQPSTLKWTEQDPLYDICSVARHPAVFKPLVVADCLKSYLSG